MIMASGRRSKAIRGAMLDGLEAILLDSGQFTEGPYRAFVFNGEEGAGLLDTAFNYYRQGHSLLLSQGPEGAIERKVLIGVFPGANVMPMKHLGEKLSAARECNIEVLPVLYLGWGDFYSNFHENRRAIRHLPQEEREHLVKAKELELTLALLNNGNVYYFSPDVHQLWIVHYEMDASKKVRSNYGHRSDLFVRGREYRTVRQHEEPQKLERFGLGEPYDCKAALIAQPTIWTPTLKKRAMEHYADPNEGESEKPPEQQPVLF
jgi:hypothetical protein